VSRSKSRKFSGKATLRDVAREAGVSVATVSYVLNNTGSVSDQVRKQVKSAIKLRGYVPNLSAQAMRTGRTKTIGMILPDLRNPFFPELAQSVENAARSNDLAVFLVDTQESQTAEAEGIFKLIQYGVEGIVWCPSSDMDYFKEYSADTPVVVIDRPLPNYDNVYSDYIKGGKLLAQHILSEGHCKIGLISGPQSFESAAQRRRGFLDELGNSAEVVWEVENSFSMELGDETRARLLQQDVSVVVAANDMIAIAAIKILNQNKIKVPETISIVGFDDIPWSDIVQPPLTTIKQPLSELGKEAVNLLMRRIENPEASKKSVVLDVDIVIRQSVRMIETVDNETGLEST